MKTEKLINAINDIDDRYVEEAHSKTKKKFDISAYLNWNSFGKLAAAACTLLLVINLFPVLFHSYGKGAAGGASYDSSYMAQESVAYNGAYASEPAEAYYVADEEAKAEEAITDTGNARQGKKLILTSYMTMETQDMDVLLEKVNGLINKYGGYVQRSSIHNQNVNSRTYDSSIRIPADKYEAFLSELKGEGNAL
ncbi:MAG: DUF4349 domain-containing protein, partial [Erysipelotrichaceae bacterium]|nr:DUF4349 domain-containing protein [Erysipelotrichaceae bacterium]